MFRACEGATIAGAACISVIKARAPHETNAILQLFFRNDAFGGPGRIGIHDLYYEARPPGLEPQTLAGPPGHHVLVGPVL